MKQTDAKGRGQEMNADKQFLCKVSAALDNSLDGDALLIMQRLDAARHAAMLRVWRPDGQQEALVQTLSDSTQELPANVSLRLDAIRQQAMARAKPGPWFARIWPPSGFAIPASALAFSCLLVTAITLFSGQNQLEAMPFVIAENELMAVSEQELELYENLEFYQWLSETGVSY